MSMSKNIQPGSLREEGKEFSRIAEEKVTNGAAQIADLSKKELSRMAKDAGSNVRRFFSEASDQAANAREKTEEAIVEHPFRAIAIAAACGAILSAVLRRK